MVVSLFTCTCQNIQADADFFCQLWSKLTHLTQCSIAIPAENVFRGIEMGHWAKMG